MQAQGLHEAAVTVFTKALRRKKDRNPALLNEAAYILTDLIDAKDNHHDFRAVQQDSASTIIDNKL